MKKLKILTQDITTVKYKEEDKLKLINEYLNSV